MKPPFVFALALAALCPTSCATNDMYTTDGDMAFDDSRYQSLRIEPAMVTLDVAAGAAATQAFRVLGITADGASEDLTAQSRFTLGNPLLGSFTGETFSSVIDRGGQTTVTASLKGSSKAAQAQLTLRFQSVIRGPDGGSALPADPSKAFSGAADAARAPLLVYPNNGALLPPNLRRLEVHFQPGAAKNRLFELTFQSPVSTVRTYLRCVRPAGGVFTAGDACVHELDQAAYTAVAESNRGGEPVQLRVRGAADDGSGGFGESALFTLSFAEADVEGALYYWKTSDPPAIMRFDFGNTSMAAPEVFLSQPKNGFSNCVGCHTLSRDGRKLVASVGGQNSGLAVYMNDLARPTTFQLKDDGANRLQFASFNPDASRFVAIYGDTDVPARNMLWMHSGDTGVRIPAESVTLPFEPSHPDWSADGQLIAVSRVGTHQTSQRPLSCGIEVLRRSGATWAAPQTVVPIVAGKSRYNPNFAPDSTFLLYSESVCPNGDNNSGECDADADNPAKTWAVLPKAGAAPVLLARVAAPGVADGQSRDLCDTFPRFSPFVKPQRGGRLFWATIASRRKAGLRDPQGKQYLWMFAIDPDAVAKGQDGSLPGFWLPFQDLTTSNHIGQWTTKVVPPLG